MSAKDAELAELAALCAAAQAALAPARERCGGLEAALAAAEEALASERAEFEERLEEAEVGEGGLKSETEEKKRGGSIERAQNPWLSPFSVLHAQPCLAPFPAVYTGRGGPGS